MTEEQIKGVTGGVVGKYLADWFPASQQELEAGKRVDVARGHIAEATRIIDGLRIDLEHQAGLLDHLAKDIEEKRQVAERYAALAETNREASAAFRAEIEETLRRELLTQASKGRRLRQVVSFVVWITTLVLGAALGAYFLDIVKWAHSSA
jgi:hypothetical protein